MASDQPQSSSDPAADSGAGPAADPVESAAPVESVESVESAESAEPTAGAVDGNATTDASPQQGQPRLDAVQPEDVQEDAVQSEDVQEDALQPEDVQEDAVQQDAGESEDVVPRADDQQGDAHQGDSNEGASPSEQADDPLEPQAQAAEETDPSRTAYEALESADSSEQSSSTKVIRTTSLSGPASDQGEERPADQAAATDAETADAKSTAGEQASSETAQQAAGDEAPEDDAEAEDDTASAAADPFAAFGAVSATSLLFHAPAPEDVSKARERAEREREEARLREVQAEEKAEEAEYEDPEPGAGVTSRRRRRRRRGSEDMELIGGDDGDPEQTVTRIRTARVVDGSAPTTVQSVKGSTRLEAKKQRRRESRQTGRRRHVITEAEFLARRESVERKMVVRQKNDRIQIGVLEDGILAEHFVSHTQQDSLIGSVYLGKVQNVLPSMEAAFVDIGRGRNAVLYAGEVNWDQADLGGAAKRIENALKPGDPVLVQATKDPVGHKGARLTSQISLPGRYLVFVPGGSMTGISRKLPDVERQRLKKILKDHLPGGAGVIVRTAAEGASEEELTNDINRLRTQWEQIQEKAGQGKTLAPELLYAEPDLTIKTVRDVFNEDFTSMIVQGDDAWDGIEAYVTYVAPDLLDRVHRWDEDEDLFAHFRVDDQIFKALERKVMLPSGGSLVIDRTEAMTVVDVNTGKFTGSGGNLEETVTKNNLEAAEEIVRQLRLRDIGGIVVIDFIDMVLEANRDLVLRRLVECLGRDRTKHQVAEVTSLGLVQMTRKRMGTGLLEVFSEDCEACDGRGLIVHDHPLKGRSTSSGDSRQGRNDRKRSRRLPSGQDERARAEDPEQAKRAEATRSALAAIASASHHDTESSNGKAEAQDGQAATGASESADGSQDRSQSRSQDSSEGREGAKRRRKRRGKRSRGRGQEGQSQETQGEQSQESSSASQETTEPARGAETQEQPAESRQAEASADSASESEGTSRSADREDRQGGEDRRSGDRARGSRSGGRSSQGQQRGGRSGGRGGRQGADSGARSEAETRSLIEARIRATAGDSADDDATTAQAPAEAPDSAADSRSERSAGRGEAEQTSERSAEQSSEGRRQRRSRTARSESRSDAEGAAQGERAAAAQRQRRSRSAGAPQAAPEAVKAPSAAPAAAAQGTASVVGEDSAESAPVRQRPRRSRRAAAPAGTPEVPASAPAAPASTPTVTAGTASVVTEADGTSQVTINGEVIELPQGQSAAEALGAGSASGAQLESLASTMGEREPGSAGPRRRPRRSRRASAPEAAPKSTTQSGSTPGEAQASQQDGAERS